MIAALHDLDVRYIHENWVEQALLSGFAAPIAAIVRAETVYPLTV